MPPFAGTERKTRPVTEPSVHVATPVFDGAHWDEEDDAGRHPTMQQIFEQLQPEAPGTDYGDAGRLIGPTARPRSTTAAPASPTTTRSASATCTS